MHFNKFGFTTGLGLNELANCMTSRSISDRQEQIIKLEHYIAALFYEI